MGLPARVIEVAPPPVPLVAVPRPEVPSPTVSFISLESSSKPRSHGKGRLTTTVSLLVHAGIIAALIVVPVLFDDILPDPDRTVRAFFVSPVAIAPPPPPPPPPAAGARVQRAPAVPRPAEPPRFVAPVEIPAEIAPEPGLDLGVEGGVAGGVEGGVPGGVVGGIVGGLPSEAPAPEPEAIRIGGNVKAPKLVRNVPPEYPMLAQQARVQGFVVLEARVGPDGAVQSVRVLRSIPLLDEAAIAAVRQWRYQPLLLNGQPMPFILSVTVSFKISM
jgi:protein TonB